MGMVTLNAAAQPAISGVGSGVIGASGEVVLARIQLTAAERAAAVRCTAVSSTGEQVSVVGLGYMVPEVGWDLHQNSPTGGCALAFAVNQATLDFVVTGAEGSSWIGRVETTFDQSYAP